MKSYVVHYKNKYPDSKVSWSDDSVDVHDKNGDHRVALRKNGAGMWVDVSEEHGCSDRHDLAPIPKEARAFKLYADGKIGRAEEHDERIEEARSYASDDGKVPSIVELAKMDAAAKKAK